MRQLTVQLEERSYPILIGSGLLAQAPQYFEQYGLTKKVRYSLLPMKMWLPNTCQVWSKRCVRLVIQSYQRLYPLVKHRNPFRCIRI